jgi:chromosome partitioning protein
VTSTDTIDPAYLDSYDRTIATANGKGGVGKTSVSTHVAAMTAARLAREAAGQPGDTGHQRRVLLIELDQQGNDEDDLGFVDGDGGRSLAACAQGYGPPEILRDVRPHLDVIAGGPYLTDLIDSLQARRVRAKDPQTPLRAAASRLASFVTPYEFVFLDCPPANNAIMQDWALSMARYLLIPTRTDKSSRRGLEEMSVRFSEARQINPQLRLLAVVLFGTNPSAKQIHAQARAWIEAALGGQAPVLESFVRYVEATAFAGRESGQLAHELEAAAVADGDKRTAKAFAGLAGDYQRVTDEVLRRVAALESEQEQA